MADRSKWTPTKGERVSVIYFGYLREVTVLGVYGRGANRQVRYRGDEAHATTDYDKIRRFRQRVEDADEEKAGLVIE